jgi:hypothetical protein
MQLSLIDPRIHPVLTAAMLDDIGLKECIQFMRRRVGRIDAAWPCVEHLIECEGRPVWAVDDGDLRYVVVGAVVFGVDDLEIANEQIRTAARAAFERLDAIEPARAC